MTEVRGETRWGLGDALAGFVLGYVVTLLLSPAIYAATGQSLSTNQNDLPLRTIALVQIPFSVTPLAVALWASWHKGRGPLIDFGLRMRWLDIPLGAAIGACTQFAVDLLYIPLLYFTSYNADDVSGPARQLTDKATGGGVVLLVLTVVVLAPICEEIFWRGLVLRSAEHRWGTTWAILFSSAAFGAAHIEPLQFPALFIFGLVAAMLATRTGRLGPGIFAHMAFNAVTVVALVR